MFNNAKINQLLASHSHRVLALMLLSLHALLIWGEQAAYLQQTFFLCTYGLFLVWQPVWLSTEKLSKLSIALFIGVGLIGFFLCKLVDNGDMAVTLIWSIGWSYFF